MGVLVFIGITTHEYLELVDWAGRAVRDDKRGAIPQSLAPILTRLGLEPTRFLEHLKGQAHTETPVMLGQIDRMKVAAKQLHRKFIRGFSEAKRLYLPLPAT